MPKIRKRKNSDYLQFRPYHAFTSHASPAPTNEGTRWWRAVLILGTMVLLVSVAVWFSRT